jgi:hypothetical protein
MLEVPLDFSLDKRKVPCTQLEHHGRDGRGACRKGAFVTLATEGPHSAPSPPAVGAGQGDEFARSGAATPVRIAISADAFPPAGSDGYTTIYVPWRVKRSHGY